MIQDIDNSYLGRTYPYINGSNDRFYKIILDSDFVQSASTIELALTLIHELFHAELYERLYRLGLISQALPDGGIVFANNPIIYQANDDIFANLIRYYTAYIPTVNNPSQYQHNLFNALNYRNNMIEDLNQINPLLDPSNSFRTIINSDPLISSMQEVLDNLSWYGLEETDEYGGLSSITIAEIDHARLRVNQYYPQTCN